MILNWILQRVCNLIEFIASTWYHWKILIFGQVIGQNSPQNIKYSVYGHTFFGHNLAIFRPIGMNVFTVTQEIIMYWLVVWCIFKRNPIFDGEMGVAAKGSVTSRLDLKIGPMDGPSGSSVISKTCFQIFGPEPPP